MLLINKKICLPRPASTVIAPIVVAVTFSFSGLVQADEALALNSPTPDAIAPQYLPTARDVQLELLPEDSTSADYAAAAQEKDLWKRIRKGFAMRELDSNLVDRHEKWYARNPEYVLRITERGRLYLHYITEEVERRGMPTEIALLPVVESAFNPGAYSVARASGIWQFIPSTGKNFGMEQTWWYDGRRDIISATNGALDYLQKLHDEFGDWHLALAAYNAGEGNVRRAIARNRSRGLPVTFNSLKLLKETRNYVPKLMAIKNIVSNPTSYALELSDIPNEPYFTAIATPNHMDVKLAAELAEISEDEFIALNPAHNRPVIIQDNAEIILLPINKITTFQDNLQAYDKPLVSWKPYQPKKGERLDKLAAELDMPLEQLKSINGISSLGNISTGQTLLVPAENETEAAEFQTFNMNLTADDRGRATRHRIRKGETLSHIARRYRVSIAKLRQWNGSLRILQIGQVITVAPPAARTSQPRYKKPEPRQDKLALNENIQGS